MKLDPKGIRYLSKEDFRVLSAVETGSRNHDIVPLNLIKQLSRLHGSGINKFIGELAKKNLITKVPNSKYIYIVSDGNDEECVLKIHRLGRMSFRNIKNKRDYLVNKKSSPSWMYMSRLSASKEFAFMKVLHQHGFPVPTPIDQNRHCIIMSHVKAIPLENVQNIGDIGLLYSDLMDLIVKLANHGLIHCDFNEFNILVTPDQKPIMIDFPQMVSTNHKDAE
ncbi:hypothetical protein BB560_003783, partial [Smittium megazygosporum]